MKSVKQQYIALKEGKMSQFNFMRNLRMTLPNLVTNVTSFKDAIKILNNKGILNENTEPEEDYIEGSLASKAKQLDQEETDDDDFYPDNEIEEQEELQFQSNEIQDIFNKFKNLPNISIKKSKLGKEFKYTYGANSLTLVEKNNIPYLAVFQNDRSHDFLVKMEKLGFGPNIFATLSKLGSKKLKGYTTFVNFDKDNSLNEIKNRITAAQAHPQELAMGRKVEMEHTDNVETAERIALDHLTEDPFYYTKLHVAGLADELDKDRPKTKKSTKKRTDLPTEVGKDNTIDKGNQMTVVKSVPKIKANANKAKKETNKGTGKITLMSLIAIKPRGVEKMAATGEKMKKITVKEGIDDVMDDNFNYIEKDNKPKNWKELVKNASKSEIEKFVSDYTKNPTKYNLSKEEMKDIILSLKKKDKLKEDNIQGRADEINNFAKLVKSKDYNSIIEQYESIIQYPSEWNIKAQEANAIIKKYFTDEDWDKFEELTSDGFELDMDTMSEVKNPILNQYKFLVTSEADQKKVWKFLDSLTQIYLEKLYEDVFGYTAKGIGLEEIKQELYNFWENPEVYKGANVNESHLNMLPNEKPNIVVEKVSEFINSNPTLRQVSDNITLQNSGDDACILKYDYWEELPSELIEKLELQFEVEKEVDDGDDDKGPTIAYILQPKLKAYTDPHGEVMKQRNLGKYDLNKLNELIKKELKEYFDGRDNLTDIDSDDNQNSDGNVMENSDDISKLKDYYQFLLNIGGGDLAGHSFQDMLSGYNQYGDFNEFIQNEIEVLGEDDPETVQLIKDKYNL